MIIEPSNARKKIREPPNVRNKLSNVMFKLHSVRMKPSNMRKKKTREPSNVTKKLTCDIGTT